MKKYYFCHVPIFFRINMHNIEASTRQIFFLTNIFYISRGIKIESVRRKNRLSSPVPHNCHCNNFTNTTSDGFNTEFRDTNHTSYCKTLTIELSYYIEKTKVEIFAKKHSIENKQRKKIFQNYIGTLYNN